MPQRAAPPAGDRWTVRYQEGLRAHSILLQHCTSCGHVRYPAGPVCPECWSEEAEWKRHSGEGEITSFVWYMQPLHPRFPETPYNVVLVRLDQGPVLVSGVPAAPLDGLRVGDRVRAIFSDEPDGFSVLLFEKTTAAPAAAPEARQNTDALHDNR